MLSISFSLPPEVILPLSKAHESGPLSPDNERQENPLGDLAHDVDPKSAFDESRHAPCSTEQLLFG